MAEPADMAPTVAPESRYEQLAAMHIAALMAVRTMVESADPDALLSGDLNRAAGLMSWRERGPELNRRAGDVQRVACLIGDLNVLLADVDAAEAAVGDLVPAAAPVSDMQADQQPELVS